jgi:SAM-dependent methyltransferase
MSGELSGESPSVVDVSIPNPSRIYDYLLGGSHNFAVDRETADRAMAAGKVTALPARANRSFLRRAVRFMIDSGVDQFLDLGSGIPTAGNVHEIAQRVNPDARVVYVDNEPVAVAQARQLLADNPNATIIGSDVRDADAVLGHPDTARLLDFSRPIGLLTVAVLHFVPDADDPAGLVRRYLADAVPGSYLALSHHSEDAYTAEKRALAAAGRAAYSRTQTAVFARTRAEIAAFLAPTELVEPGIVWTPQWRPDGGDPEVTDPAEAEIYAAVGRLR